MSGQKAVEGHGARRPARVKIITLGDAKVGKSCLVKRFCAPRFEKEHLPTIGVDCGVKAISLPGEGGGEERDIRVDFFDLSGDPDYREVRNEFYRNADGILLVFDVARKASFEALGSWLDEAQLGLSPESEVVVMANKTDRHPRQVTEQEGTSNATYFETSAKRGTNVEEAFSYLVERLARRREKASSGAE